MKTGGVAQYVVTPRSHDELQEVVAWCHGDETPIHVLGGGSNVLIRDDGVSGVVLRLTDPAFAKSNSTAQPHAPAPPHCFPT